MELDNLALPASQPILEPATEAAIFLTLTVEPGGEQAARDLLTGLSALRRSIGFRDAEAELSCVVGIGSIVWDRLFSGPRPADLRPFSGYAGARHSAPATPGDLLFHIRAHRLERCFELAGLIVQRLGTAVKVTDEVHGFTAVDQRDLLGFVDGTENPEGAEAVDAVTIGPGDADFAGGSYVTVQKYLHDLPAWNSLSVAEQERVVGRTKVEDIELDDDVKPANSHVALNTLPDADGNEPELVRANMSFGHVGLSEFGTYFIAYAKDPGVVERLLENMFIGNPPGNYDRILDFSTAVTGALFFVPSSGFLDSLPAPAGAAATLSSEPSADGTSPGDAHAAQSGGETSAEGSLGIGSLRED